MRYQALQRALVVAQFDDGFLDELAARPDAAPLGAKERAELLRADRRAFRTDPLRRRRTLRVLAEEYPASTTLALAETRSLAFAEAFFSSSAFRRAVFEDRPLALAFGEYLAGAGLTTPQLADVLRLERTRARCRRERRLPPARGVALAPGVAAERFFGGVLETIQKLETWLFEIGLMPQVALCDDPPRLPPLPDPALGDPVHLLFAPSDTDVALIAIDDGLYRLLSSFRTPLSPDEARGALRRLGVAASTLSSLADEGILSLPDATSTRS